MQNTRLNNLFDLVLSKFRRWLINPWRYFSIILICVLLGVFLGSAIPTTAGQAADWDIVAAGVLMLFTEGVSWLVYYRRRQLISTESAPAPRPFLFLQMLNALKIGLTYSLFVEAFKIGS